MDHLVCVNRYHMASPPAGAGKEATMVAPRTDRADSEVPHAALASVPQSASGLHGVVDLQAILNLPKGTERFMSDLHGEYKAFMHILNNCSGVVREHVDEIFGDELTSEQKGELCTLIYYPSEKIARVRAAHLDSPSWYKENLDNLIQIARALSSR